MGTKNLLDGMIELIAVHHDEVAATQATYFDIGAYTDDLKSFGVREAWMGFFHLHLIKKRIL